MVKVYTMELAGRTLRVEIGKVGKQANGCAFMQYGETTVLSTATASEKPRDGIDFFPCSVEYEEKLYAVGKIPGGFNKREGKASENAILTSRVIDRPMRPLFPKDYRNDVTLNNMVMSVDPACRPELVAMLGTSIATCISDIPFDGPCAMTQVGMIDGELIINPSQEQWDKGDLKMTVASTAQKVIMIEAGANEVPEATVLEAIYKAHDVNQTIIAFINQIVAEVGKKKHEYVSCAVPQEMFDEMKKIVTPEEMEEAVFTDEKQVREENIRQVTAKFEEAFADKEDWLAILPDAVYQYQKKTVRKMILKDHKRPDGRAIDQIRPLSAEVDIIPRVHGSAMFTRGQTQICNVCTLAPLSEVQKVDGLDPNVTSKRYMHHYNFPPYSVGETGRMGAPGRREIGHGALGERALAQVIPSEKDFPYTIRVVSKVLESNGSSSQASICASSMALMAAGVPISNPVSGVAMGLVKKGDDYTILTDIQGMEDHLGDMDFKVAGTKNGICALQMDIKIDGITKEILQEALAQAKVGRAQIMDCMLGAIPAPRDHLSKYAPKMHVMHIDPEQIRDVIGRGGETINEIIEKSNDVKIDIDQDGTVVIYHSDQEAIDTAVSLIERIVKKAEVGEIYDGTIARVNDNYAFVTLFEGTDGFLHISDWSYERTSKMQDVCKVGDVIKVKVTKVDDKGKVNVSRKALLPKPVKKEEKNEKNEK